MKILIDNIIKQLRDVQEGKNWMGENFKKKLDSIAEDDVFIRPIPSLHSVAELISHLTTWRKETVLKIKTGKGLLTDDCKENWLDNTELRKMGWDNLLGEYQNSLSELIALLQMKEDDFLTEKYYDPDFKGFYDYAFVIYGMIHHDIYHLGQLGIVIKMINQSKNNPH